MDLSPNTIRVAIARQRLTKSDVAARVGITPSALSQILRGARHIKAEEVPLLIAALRLDLIPITGNIGNGSEISELPNPQDMIRLPFVPVAEQEAFRIIGDHLLPRYADGDVVVAWVHQRKALEAYYGHEVVVRLQGSPRRLLKHIVMPVEGVSLGAPRVRLMNSFTGRGVVEGTVVTAQEIAGQLRAYQLHPVEPGILSAIPDPF